MKETSIAQVGADFLREMFENLGCAADITTHQDGQTVRFRVDGAAERIGDRADLVSALSLLTSRVLSRQGHRCDCILDFGGHFEARAEFLSRAAEELGAVAINANQRVLVANLSSVERKIMHHALAENEAISTRSDGRQIRRFIVEPNEESAQ